MKILTSENDDFLYERILKLLYDVKITQGGTDLYSTLRRHPKIKNYLLDKQRKQIAELEEQYFLEDGQLNQIALTSWHQKRLTTTKE